MPLTNCHACGASMSTTELYCPRCNSPRLQTDQPASTLGLWAVGGIVALALLGVMLKLAGLF
ncbi:MAG: hypothetical protein IRY99_13355 [Isosphaeraceae bacterium]|nr:hypothetical protein [Isosphaeraceae bacterium]